jgi:hypothetical protein
MRITLSEHSMQGNDYASADAGPNSTVERRKLRGNERSMNV